MQSPHTFPGIGSSSPLLFLARKYAVLDGPGFPIVSAEPAALSLQLVRGRGELLSAGSDAY